MVCPYCRTPLRETSPECPSCKLTLPRAAALLGPVPRLSTGVSDSTRLLGKRSLRKVADGLAGLTQRFPQLRPHVVLREFQKVHPFDLQVFWLFNCAGFFAEDHKGGHNHGILLAIDPPNGRAAITLGYGLEPLVSDQALIHLLEQAEPAWRAADYAGGILTVIQGLETLLADLAEQLPVTLGIPPEQVADPAAREF
jgi:hypothetical protein